MKTASVNTQKILRGGVGVGRHVPPSLVKVIQGISGVIGLLVLWQVFASFHVVSPEYFPGALSIVGYTFSLLVSPTFLVQIWATIESMVIGLLISVVIAVPIGLFLGRLKIAYRMTQLLVEALRPIPAVALAPLAILMFGLSNRSTVFLVVWTSVWPILINTVYGVHGIDTLRIETAKVFGFSRLTIIRRIALPSTAPFIGTGIRISLAIALSVAIAGEMVASSGNGIGGWVLEESANGSLLPIYGATIISGLVGYLMNLLMELLESKVFFWDPSHRRQLQ